MKSLDALYAAYEGKESLVKTTASVEEAHSAMGGADVIVYTGSDKEAARAWSYKAAPVVGSRKYKEYDLGDGAVVFLSQYGAKEFSAPEKTIEVVEEVVEQPVGTTVEPWVDLEPETTTPEPPAVSQRFNSWNPNK
jgi:hypothetical protein|tara:strand:- start:2655 stop:3062 length:408 start_codon:yes stop_codon:yes gene_type:complete